MTPTGARPAKVGAMQLAGGPAIGPKINPQKEAQAADWQALVGRWGFPLQGKLGSQVPAAGGRTVYSSTNFLHWASSVAIKTNILRA